MISISELEKVIKEFEGYRDQLRMLRSMDARTKSEVYGHAASRLKELLPK